MILDLSNNNLGYEGTKKLSEFIIKPNCFLVELNLESNKLGSKAIDVLIIYRIYLSQLFLIKILFKS